MPFINKLPKKPRSNNSEKKIERHKFYNNTKWLKLRLAKLHQTPLCEVCTSSNKITLATQVHHKESFMKGKTQDEKLYLFYDYENLMSICDVCHGNLHANQQKNND